jgi:hypothetical protein
MTISQAQYVDLLVKKLYGVATTDNAENKSPSNESISSPQLNRGDTVWTEANQIPNVAVNITNLSLQYGNSNPIQCVPDTTSVPILNSANQQIYPTWLTNVPEWIPPEFGGSYAIQAYVGPANIANLTGANVTFISSSGEGSSPDPGEFYFDYQAGLLYFIGETIPNVLTSGNVVYITGFQYTGLTGVTNLPSNTNIGNINIVDTTISSTDSNLITFDGSSGVVLPSGNSSQRPGNANIGATRFNTIINALETYDGVEWVTGGNIVTPGTITDQQIIPDGTSSTFSLNQTTSSAGILVSINGVTQVPTVAYTVTGNSITFTQVPLTQDLIDVRFISYATTVSSLTNQTGNASISVTPAGNILFTTNGNVLTTMSANTVAIAGGVSAVGNITTSGYFVGNIAGNISGNIVAPGSNTQVLYNNSGNLAASAGFTFTQSSNAMIVSGNITGANISTSGQINATGNIIAGNVSATNLSGNLTSGTQSNITGLGTLNTLTVNGNVSAGNISTQLISATGNVTTGNILPGANVTYNLGSPTQQWKSLYISGNTIYIGNYSISTNDNGLFFGSNAVLVANIPVTGDIVTTGNVIAASFTGEGGNLSNITAANVNGTVATANIATTAYNVSAANVSGTVAAASVAGTVTTAAQPNITSVGTLTSLNVSGAVSASGNIRSNGNILGGGIVSTTGNISGNYFFGNGSLLTGIASSYGNADVAAYLPTYTGILNPGSVSATGNIQGSYVLGNGAFLTGIPASYGNTNVANYLPTYTGNLAGGNISVTGNITGNNLNIVRVNSTSSITAVTVSTSGNITAPYFVGNVVGNISGNLTVPGSTNQVIYNNSGQANASAGLTFDFTSNSLVSTGTITGSNFLTAGYVSATGNIIGNYFVGNGSTLRSITGANVTGNVANATFSTSAGTAATITTNAQPNITSVGTLSSLIVSANTTTGNLLTGGLISATGNITTSGYFLGTFQGNVSGNITVPGSNTQVLYNNSGNAGASAGLTFDSSSNSLVSTGTITGSNFLTGGYVSATGNITGNYFVGNGSTLTSITGANITGNVANATYAISSGTAATVTTNAQSNITSVGTLTSLSVSGSATAGNLLTAGIVSATGNITTSGYFLGTFQGNVSGNLTVPGSNTQVIYNANGIAGASAGLTFDSSSNSLVSTGTITGSNFLTGGYVSVAGNVTSSQFVGSGNTLSNIQGANVSGTVANATYAASAGYAATITSNAQPNITSTGTLTSLSVTGSTTAGNLLTAGLVSAGGNIISNGYFIGTFLGNISGNLTVPGVNTQIIYNNNGNAGASAGLTFNASTNALTVSGNATLGNILTNGIVSVGGNITSGNINATNLTGTAVSITGNVTGSQFIGSGNTLTNIQGANVSGNVSTAIVAGTVTTNAQPNITSVGVLTSLSVSGNATPGNILTTGIVSATGNITTSGYFLGTFQGNVSGNLTVPGSNTQVIYNNNGNAGASAGFTFNAASNALVSTGNITGGNILTTGIISVTGNITGGNINVTNHTGNIVSVTGNITGSQFIGSGNTLSNIQGANVSGTVSAATTANTASTVTGNAQANITSVGVLTGLSVSGQVTATGNVSAYSYITTGPAGGISGTGNIIGGNLLTGGFVSAAGNITGNYFVGNGSLLTGIGSSYGNANVASYLPTFSGNLTAGNISAIGTITGTTISVPNASLSYNSNAAGWVSNVAIAPVANTSYNLGTASLWWNNLYAVNVNSANTVATNIISATGNITGGNIITAGLVSATGNITGGNIRTAGQVSATGNITANTFVATGSGGGISGTGNIVTGNLTSTGNISFSNWTIYQSGTKLYFAYNGTALFSFDSTGTMTAANTVVAPGTP